MPTGHDSTLTEDTWVGSLLLTLLQTPALAFDVLGFHLAQCRPDYVSELRALGLIAGRPHLFSQVA
jgi:hypothetical protein